MVFNLRPAAGRLLALGVGLAALACAPAARPADSAAPAKPATSAPQAAAPAAQPAASAAAAPASAAPATSAPAASAQAGGPNFPPLAEPYKVRISYPSVNGSMTTIWVGQDAGIFRKYGIESELQFISSTTVGTQALIGGDIDFSFLAGTAGVEAIVAGAPLRIVAGTENKIVQSLITSPQTRSITDLRGKRLGVTRFGSLTDYSARYLLQKAGMSPEQDVAMVQVTGMPEILTAMQAGALDAGVVSPPTLSSALKAGYHSIAEMTNEPLDYPAQYLATSQANIEQRPDLVRRMVYAVTEALHRTRTDRATTEQAAAKYMQTTDPDQIAEAFDAYLPGRQRSPLVSEAALQGVLQDVSANHPQAAQLSPKALLDLRYAEEVVQSGFLDRLYQ